MELSSLPPEWLKKFSDPYAVLGISVAADDRRVLKRYRNVAKVLHPDSMAQADEATREFATQLFGRLVNPAYQKLKQEKGRAETVALLRFQVRRVNREAPLVPKAAISLQLLNRGAQEADVFYEQAIAQLAEAQYQSLEQFEAITEQMGELNLVFLQLKMGEVFIREKRTGLITAPTEVKVAKISEDPRPVENYAQRHYQRAQEYMKKGAWPQAVQELRDAIKLEAGKSEYHALLGLAYLQQNLNGMATVYFRQALKLNPKDPLAQKYAAKLGIQASSTPPTPKETRRNGLFNMFRAKQ